MSHRVAHIMCADDQADAERIMHREHSWADTCEPAPGGGFMVFRAKDRAAAEAA